MKYITPKYTKEEIESSDIILASTTIALDGGATLIEIDGTTANVSTSVNSILGLR